MTIYIRHTYLKTQTNQLTVLTSFETLTRLTLSQNQRDLSNNNLTQPIPRNSILTNNKTCNLSQNSIVHSHNQSTIILQQFSMRTQELKKITNKVSSNITKITQAYTAAQENIGKLIDNAISHTLKKAQDVTKKQIGPHPGQQLTLLCHNNWKMTHIRLKDLTKHRHPHMLMQTNSPQSDHL